MGRMQNNKRLSSLSKKLVELSKENGVLTEARVGEVLSCLRQVNSRNNLILLKSFLSRMRRELSFHTAVIYTPNKLSDHALTAIAANCSKTYGRTISSKVEEDNSLIAGVRIRVGDDLYDMSLAGQLQRLCDTVS